MEEFLLKKNEKDNIDKILKFLFKELKNEKNQFLSNKKLNKYLQIMLQTITILAQKEKKI